MPQIAPDNHADITDGDRFLTISQVGELVQISPRTLRAMWADGRGPRRLRIGGQIRIRLSDALAWADSNSDTR